MKNITPYSVHIIGEVAVLEVPVRVDSNNSMELDKNLSLVIENNLVVLCDFKNTTYISSMGLRTLLNNLKSVKKSGKILALCSLSEYIQEILDITGFTRLFLIYPSETDAISGLNQLLNVKNLQKNEE